MLNCSESPRRGRAVRCAVRDGRLGLVRYYSWRTPACSRKCVDRLKARRASDRSWLPWPQIALDQATENRGRVPLRSSRSHNNEARNTREQQKLCFTLFKP
jgi:hypothetical protein